MSNEWEGKLQLSLLIAHSFFARVSLADSAYLAKVRSDERKLPVHPSLVFCAPRRTAE